jgi:cytochrome c oxidase subunit 3
MANPHEQEHAEHDGHGHNGHGHPEFLHHHFETPLHQFESDKLGMWLFLATEILLFGGLFCAYSVYRANHPEIFIYAHQYLNKIYGGVNTIVLIFSSFTMAWAVRAAQTNQQRLLVTLLAITIACGGIFMGIKYVEYKAKFEHGLLWGQRYNPTHEEGHGDTAHGTAAAHAEAAAPGDAGAAGSTAQPAHSLESGEIGTAAAPEPGAVQDVLQSPNSDQQHQALPGDVVPPAAEAKHDAPAADTGTGSTLMPNPAPLHGDNPAEVNARLSGASPATTGGPLIEASTIKPASQSPDGLAAPVTGAHHWTGAEPKNVQTFFSIYFIMTGLHAIHVIIGMIVMFIMMILAMRGKFNAQYFTPIDLTGLYWHIVDLIWIFLFPLLYLIGNQ